MRISDWSSDVCSSDLLAAIAEIVAHDHLHIGAARRHPDVVERKRAGLQLAPRNQGAVGIHLDGTRRFQHAGNERLWKGDQERVLVECTRNADTAEQGDRKSTRLNSSHSCAPPMPSSA